MIRESGKVIGNIYCGNRDYESKEVGLNREAHFKQNIYQFLAEYHVHRITRMCMDECLVYDTP